MARKRTPLPRRVLAWQKASQSLTNNALKPMPKEPLDWGIIRLLLMHGWSMDAIRYTFPGLFGP